MPWVAKGLFSHSSTACQLWLPPKPAAKTGSPGIGEVGAAMNGTYSDDKLTPCCSSVPTLGCDFFNPTAQCPHLPLFSCCSNSILHILQYCSQSFRDQFCPTWGGGGQAHNYPQPAVEGLRSCLLAFHWKQCHGEHMKLPWTEEAPGHLL